MPRLLVALLAAVLLVPAAAAAGATPLLETDSPPATPVEVQLDADPELERALVVQLSEFERRVFVEDTCAGTVRRLAVGRPETFVALVALDVPGRPQLLLSGSSGASGRLQQALAVRLGVPTPATPCPGLETTFRSPARTGPFALPSRYRASTLGGYSVVDRQVAGRDRLRQFAGYYGRSDPGCCPRWTRTIDWQWSSARDRWERAAAVRYRRAAR